MAGEAPGMSENPVPDAKAASRAGTEELGSPAMIAARDTAGA
jgi:hypothetical protein